MLKSVQIERNKMENLNNLLNEVDEAAIAVIGMAGRFPGAKDVSNFWRNLQHDTESIIRLSDEEIQSAGIAGALLNDPNYVKAQPILDDIDLFDASFFGFTPREAELVDPQHRLFLECAWQAIENAGYNPDTYKGSIGVYGGSAQSTYLIKNLYSNPALVESVNDLMLEYGTAPDYLTTRVSYKLNLKGPSVAVQTACSTSLVAVHLACQSLLNGECEMALAGGAFIKVPQKSGYLYQEGGILSPDGHCRAFDARAQGTVFGHGVGIVLLKRLPDALEDKDYIYAVIKGSAINNDGSFKVGYTAPSVEGQANVIAEALAVADVDAETVSYIEAHGTGTPLGDPVEINALTQAFRANTELNGFCAIGSVKTNIGHLDIAAGVAGLIKTVFMLKHKVIPASLHFEQPNPRINFVDTPFYVNAKRTGWKTDRLPRRAGVSSFGIGGTNAHVVLEEAPELESTPSNRPHQLLLLSAKTKAALENMTNNLARHLRQNPNLNLADVAYTLQVGRSTFNHRRVVVCSNMNDAVVALETPDPKRVFTAVQESKDHPVVFMFPGQGSQYPNMASELYQAEPIFREAVDGCAELLVPHLGFDLRQVLYPSTPEQFDAATRQLKQTAITQPALFVTEYSLAKLWMSWGVQPQAMIGHSIGEYVAACLAGVFSLEDALALVAIRGQLMQSLPGGTMLAVQRPAQEIQPLLFDKLSLAAINSPSLCVVSGTTAAIERLEHQLVNDGVPCRQLHTSHAFHSEMMGPILEPFVEWVRNVNLAPPQIPLVSNVTGAWITGAEATDAGYWARHLRQTVRFAEGMQSLLKDYSPILLEVGPGQTLSSLARQQPQANERVILTSLRHPQDKVSDVALLLTTLGRLWLAGVQPDWTGFYGDEQRRRLPLPTYPFERKRYWINAQKQPSLSSSAPEPRQRLDEAPILDQIQTEKNVENTYDDAPRDQVEQSIAKLWQKVLGVEQVKIHDNFFELGGSSLIAVDLFAQINKLFGKNIPLATLFEAPTVAQLAGVVREEEGKTPDKCLVEIQPGIANRPPFFCIHEESGIVLGYYDLARYLGKDQPFYALQAQGLNGETVGAPQFEDMAAHYLKEIQTVQPKGPYYLGGYCLGGELAFEIAQQLQEQGEEVALVAMIQSRRPEYFEYVPGTTFIHRFVYRIIERADYELHNLRRVGPKTQIAYLWQRSERVLEKLQFKLGSVIKPFLFKLNMNITHSQTYIYEALAKAHDQAWFNYQVRPYSGSVVIFRTEKQPLGINPDPTLGWRKWLKGNLQLYKISGYHQTVLKEPYVQTLAKQLRACLDKAQNKNKLAGGLDESISIPPTPSPTPAPLPEAEQ